jgi:hypothetical protein
LNRATGVKTTEVIPESIDTWATGIAQNAEGHLILSLAHNERALVVDLETHEVLVEVSDRIGQYGTLAPDAKWFAMPAQDWGIDLYSTATGQRVFSFDFLDDASLEAAARLDAHGNWQFTGPDAAVLHDEYFCKFGSVYAPHELCEPPLVRQ